MRDWLQIQYEKAVWWLGHYLHFMGQVLQEHSTRQGFKHGRPF